MIKQFDLRQQFANLKPEIDRELEEIFSTGQFCLSDKVKEFEENFAKYIGTKYAIGVNSGSAALTLSLEALGISLGDEVIVPANTYIATAFAVSHVRATPVFVDHNKYFNIDIKDVINKITNKTKAIIPVHLYGQPADMGSLTLLARDYELKIVEDCAQATGASIGNKKVGSYGNTGCFSFYPTKNLGGCGDGGMIVTDDNFLKEKLLQLRNDGQTKKYQHDIIGHNERLDAIQSAILNIKLKYLDEWNMKRRRIANLYRFEIKRRELPIEVPLEKIESYHVYHQYVVQIENRDYIRKTLWDNYRIRTNIHYPIPIHKQGAYKQFNNTHYPEAEKNAKKLLSLPMYPELSLDEAFVVIDKLDKIIRSK